MKAYMRRKRELKRKEAEERKEKEIDRHFRAGDLNFGIPCEKPKFVDYQTWKKSNPTLKFKQYLEQKRQFDRENRDYGQPLRTPNTLSASEREFAKGLGMLESTYCQQLRKALRNATNPMWIRELKQQLLEDCGIEI